MLQRIQSVYLLLAAIASGIFFFTPISNIEINNNFFIIKASGVYFQDGDSFVFDSPLLALSSVLLFHVFLSLLTMLQFKKRNLQITLCNLNLVLLFAGMALVFFYGGNLPEKAIDSNASTITYSFGGLIPLFSIAMIFLAKRSINKDDKLVKSADRLR